MLYLHLWAKTSPTPGQCEWHPLPYHLLDVAAVAERMIGSDRFPDQIAEAEGIDASTLRQMIVLLVALHDIGKACLGFQAKSDDQWPRVRDCLNLTVEVSDQRYEADHTAVTAHYLLEPQGDTILHRVLPELPDYLLGPIAGSVAGHHGRPVSVDPDRAPRLGPGFETIARTLIDDLQTLLAPLACPLQLKDDATLAAFCWWLASLLPVADWIGSNSHWFPFHPPDLDLETYWTTVARPRARVALGECGLAPVAVAPASAARTLPGIARLSPLQRWAETVRFPGEGPLLAIIEDATGAGKTEAALLLAHRLMADGRASGLYTAMPTMATANAMYARMEASYRHFCADGAEPSLVLAHGKARLHNHFIATVDDACAAPAEADSVSGFCNRWFSDDRRKALLAQFGTGTIDQALLAVLPARYQSLRLHGLAGKVLVLDEVHAYDAYVQRELETLITFVAMLGGSVILLSATLPTGQRQRLCQAFCDGLDWRAGGSGATPSVTGTAYPQATLVSGSGAEETPLAMRDGTERSVRVERVASVDAALDLAIDLARRGAAVAMIRSTVARVQDSCDRLRDLVDDVPVDLFHARYMIEDRNRIEQDCLRRFGRDGGAEARRGRILVASQVIEQSLDIDFDVLITDLAPVDLLIQRAGRLWRHRREARPLNEPVLHVLSPEPRADADANWLDSVVPEAGWIYDPASLWLSARGLFDAGRIATRTLAGGPDPDPAHVRALVESVYGPGAQERVPAALQAVFIDATGIDQAKRSVAVQTLLEPDRPYAENNARFEDEAQVRTRMDQGSRAVWLAVERDGVLVPAATALDETVPALWAFSEVSVTKRMSCGLQTVEAISAGDADRFCPAPAKFESATLCLPMRPEAGGRLMSECGWFVYCGLRGLSEIPVQDEA